MTLLSEADTCRKYVLPKLYAACWDDDRIRDDNRDTYRYFGNPIYTYSLRQGIADGFLAPYRVQRIVTTVDATGWRPSKGELDRYGREIPDAEYGTPDFERKVALKVRTEAIARNLTEFLRNTDPFAKTIVFCVDQEHAEDMRKALNNLSADTAKKYPEYVVRVTADEGKTGRGNPRPLHTQEVMARDSRPKPPLSNACIAR